MMEKNADMTDTVRIANTTNAVVVRILPAIGAGTKKLDDGRRIDNGYMADEEGIPMNPTIIASLISALAAIAVCMINNHFQDAKVQKAHNDNIVLIDYRLKQLEQKVDAHNSLIERTYALERRADVMEEKQTVANHRIDDLEKHEDDRR